MAFELPKRLWTLAEARDAVDGLDEMLHAAHGILQRRADAEVQIRELAAEHGPSVEEPGGAGHDAYRVAIGALQEAQAEYLGVVDAFFLEGVSLKHGKTADMLAAFGASIAFLCYTRGEPGIGHWHDIEEECDERRPLPDGLA